MSAPDLEFHSGVSAFTGEPFVMVQWGHQTGQLTPAEAEAHAIAVIQAAQAARHDAAIMAELMSNGGFGREAAAGFIGALRKRLEDLQ